MIAATCIPGSGLTHPGLAQASHFDPPVSHGREYIYRLTRPNHTSGNRPLTVLRQSRNQSRPAWVSLKISISSLPALCCFSPFTIWQFQHPSGIARYGRQRTKPTIVRCTLGRCDVANALRPRFDQSSHMKGTGTMMTLTDAYQYIRSFLQSILYIDITVFHRALNQTNPREN